MGRPNLPGAPRTLTADEAYAIYAVLVEDAGARDEDGERHSFVHYAVGDRDIEWRFCGCLGFGGKLYSDGRRVPLIGCYPEDRTPEREAVIERVNARLAEMFAVPSESPDHV